MSGINSNSGVIAGLPAARTPAQVLADIVTQRLPYGWAWNGAVDSNLGQFFAPLADMIATIEQTANAQLAEVDPRTSVQLIPNYETVLGPDPAGRDQAPQTLEQQQAMVFQRWTALGGQSPAYFTSLGTLLGVPVAISQKPVISVCGPPAQTGIVCGPQTRCVPASERFTWVVTLPAANPSSAGVAAMIALYAPAHTVCVIEYV